MATTKSPPTLDTKIGNATLENVPLDKMRVSALAQRSYRPHDARKIADEFDPNKFGILWVSERDGWYWIIDGQTRCGALKLLGWDEQKIECMVFHGLTEKEEAELFLGINDGVQVPVFEEFRVAVNAGRHDEVAIKRIVQGCGLRIQMGKDSRSISAVGTLRKLYREAGEGVLKQTLVIIRDAFGDRGLTAEVIRGVGAFCQRYEGVLDQDHAIAQLTAVRGGVTGLLGQAELLHNKFGGKKMHCVAAAVVDAYNRGGRKKVKSYWKADPKAAAA